MEWLRIRAFDPEDLPALTKLYHQRSVAAGTLRIPYYTVAELREHYQPSATVRRLVAETDQGIIGDAGLHLYSGRRKHVGSIGMGVDEAFQGRGVGTRLMEELMDLADNWYNLLRVELQVYDDNHAGIRLYEKFGFVIEGVHRAYAFREGAYADAVTMARIKPPVELHSMEGEQD
jgi:L-phenylalanine/L-methionine N-acetyltransferase